MVLVVSHSHLFRGARLTTEHAPPASVGGASEVVICFMYGVEIDAELVDGAVGDLVLVVPSYRTAAGHVIDAAVWPVTAVDTDCADTGPHLRLGRRLA